MTQLRRLVLNHAERVLREGETLSPTRISRALGLSSHTTAVRVVKDLRRMGKLPPTDR